MNIYNLLLRVYPRVWRDRYEEEFLVVLASHPFSLFEGIDVMRGALDAHLHPYFGTTALVPSERMRLMLSTLRRSLLVMFCAFSAFLVAGIAFQKLAEDHDFVEAAQAHSLVGLSFDLVVIGAVAALLAVLTGGLPIVAAVGKYDAVGSFGVVIAVLLSLLSVLRVVRRNRTDQQNTLLARTQFTVAATVLVTLVTDSVAMIRHVPMWMNRAGAVELVMLMEGMIALALCLALVIHSPSVISPLR